MIEHTDLAYLVLVNAVAMLAFWKPRGAHWKRYQQLHSRNAIDDFATDWEKRTALANVSDFPSVPSIVGNISKIHIRHLPDRTVALIRLSSGTTHKTIYVRDEKMIDDVLSLGEGARVRFSGPTETVDLKESDGSMRSYNIMRPVNFDPAP